MTKKLLPKTLRVYLLFALVVILAGGPVFYMITQWFYREDTNETLQLTKMNFLKNTLPQLKEQDITSFNRLNWNIKLLPPDQSITRDSYQNIHYPDSLEHEDETYHVLLSPVQIEGYSHTLLVRINMIESGNLVESIALVFMAIILLLLSGLYLITKRISVRLWEPFYNSLEQIEKFEIDKNDLPSWKATDIEEFGRLNNAVNVLIERNVAIYKSQREFIENAAHELQTPLAAFQAKLENLMQITSLTREQATSIDDLIHAAGRLTRLNKNLLLLSKLNKGSFPDLEEVSLNNVLKKQIEFFKIQAEAKDIEITSQIEGSHNIKTNTSLLESMLSNLFLNAIRHNHRKGTIDLELRSGDFRICNTGKDKPLDVSAIFERFGTTDPTFKGTGLGLSIVKKIADLNGWEIKYSWENKMHCFEVRF